MKKYFLILVSLFFINTGYSQVVYTETFNNYTFGLLGVDFKAKVPGQGGWFTYSLGNTQSNSPFTIVSEPGRGNVLDITSPLSDGEGFRVWKTNINPAILNRTPGNNVLKFEIDYFTGAKQPTIGNNDANITILGKGDPLIGGDAEYLVSIGIIKSDGKLDGYTIDYSSPIFYDNVNNDYYLPLNTWVKIILYLDYNNKKVYFDIPYLNKVFKADFLINSTSTNLFEDHVPDTIMFTVSSSVFPDGSPSYTRNKYDDIKITALSEVPPEVIALNTNQELAKKFNLYPNPTTNIISITNNDNMFVDKVQVYDLSGKLINTQNFNNETEIQLNVENLTSGIYMLHLQTDQGIAVKKLIKK